MLFSLYRIKNYAIGCDNNWIALFEFHLSLLIVHVISQMYVIQMHTCVSLTHAKTDLVLLRGFCVFRITLNQYKRTDTPRTAREPWIREVPSTTYIC